MLQTDIQEANLNPEDLKCFYVLIKDIAQNQDSIPPLEMRYLNHLFPEVANVDASPIEKLWPHSDLLLTTCVYMAVLNGRYPIDKARKISKLAHQFGFSARKLRTLEEQALRTIQYKGQQMPEDLDVKLKLPKGKNTKENTSATQQVSYGDFMKGLWQSDMDLIQHTEGSLSDISEVDETTKF